MAIIGGGACGTMFLHDYISLLEGRPAAVKAQPPKILWFDRNGHFGHADAFDPHQPDCLTLNNPVAMMQPTLINPKIFHDFCTRTYGACDHSAFLPRNVYGRFLKELTPTLFQRAQALGIEIKTIHSTTKAIHKTPNGHLIIKDDDRFRPVDDVVMALGPAPNHAAQHLQGERGYIASPSRYESFEKSGIDFSNPKTRIACFGPGASCFDGMALLEKEFGFKGTYILIGESSSAFWSLRREKPIPTDVGYPSRFLQPGNLPCPVTATQLKDALQRDVAELRNPSANPHDLGPEYPLFAAAAKSKRLMGMWEKQHKPNALERAQAQMAFNELQRYAIKILEHAVAPQMLDLYKDLQRQGRILHIEGRAQIDKITKVDQEFQIPVLTRNPDLTHCRIRYLAEGFMNAKPFARSWDAVAEGAPLSPQERLLHGMRNQGLIQQVPGDQLGLYTSNGTKNSIVLLGAATDALWGVHLACYKNLVAADSFAQRVIGPRTAPDLTYV